MVVDVRYKYDLSLQVIFVTIGYRIGIGGITFTFLHELVRRTTTTRPISHDLASVCSLGQVGVKDSSVMTSCSLFNYFIVIMLHLGRYWFERGFR